MGIADYLNLANIWLRTYLPERRRWKTVSSSNSSIRISYGYDNISGPGQQVFGGLVKLQDLETEFPNNTVNPNILYLISSALPYFPVRMAIMAKKAGVKLVVNQNGVAYPGWHGKGWEATNRPMKKLHGLADYVCYQSHFCKLSADRFLGTPVARYDILYNPVDTGFFCPSEDTREKEGKITLLLAGSHWSFYRPRIAIDVLQRVRRVNNRVYLKIAGRFCWEKNPGRAVQQVKSYAASLGVADAVEFTGPYTQQQALKLFHSCSILLHTKYNDPCPRLVVEAMACGLPVVYSATGGVPELVGAPSGVGVGSTLDWEQDHPPAADALADAVLVVISNLDLYAQAARKNAVEKFDVKPWLQKHRKIFKSLLE